MTRERFREVLDQLGWSVRSLALDRLGCNKTTVQRWASGEQVIPVGVAHWLERRVALDAACPPPEDWHAVSHDAA